MVKVTEVVDLFLAVCPTAKPNWDEHLKFWEGEPAGHDNDVAVFAYHIVDCYERAQTEAFERVFQLVERLILEGDVDTQGVVILGFLVSLQCTASHKIFGSVVFEPYLLPNSSSVWCEIEEIWEG